ncbi:GTP cyclohydrolase II [Ascosphaera aggregata]|nr:GTP cyclohydrolase II [Ascosphaera aggregata]
MANAAQPETMNDDPQLPSHTTTAGVNGLNGGSADLAHVDSFARLARGSLHHPPVSLHPPPPSSANQPSASSQRGLLPKLPHVECVVRARIPTTTGAEMFLHLYHNDIDNKEHLAIVFGHEIRSRSLDRVRPGETEMDRMIRGAYVGRLRPGRTSSRYDEEEEVKEQDHQQQQQQQQQQQMNANGDMRRTYKEAPLVRIHSECYTGETAWSARCDCGEQLDEAARLMSESVDPPPGSYSTSISSNSSSSPSSSSSSSSSSSPNPKCAGGVIVYLRQEGRGIGLGEKLKAYNLQDLGNDTVEANLLLRHPADGRSYGLATAILVDLGLGRDATDGAQGQPGGKYGGIRLLTNNPDKVRAVEGPGREVVVKERVPMVPIAWRTKGEKGIRSAEIEGYLRTKIGKMGHMIE